MDRMNAQFALQESWTEADARRAVRGRAAHVSGRERRRHILTRAMELDVIPELLRRHRSVPPGMLIAEAQVSALAGLVLRQDEPAALAYVLELRAQGAAMEQLFLDLLAPAARTLGAMWEADTCDFTEVTVGLWKLQSAMRALAPLEVVPSPNAPRVMLVPLPGEDHSFGLSMVYEFFRRAGWNAWTGQVENSAALRSIVAKRPVAVIGFSLACDDRLDDARKEIAAVRRASRNPDIAIMVGGPGFTANPALAASVGADATARDGHDAVLQAAGLVANAAYANGRARE